MLVGNEKLLAVRAQVEALLHANDCAGHVVLHTPGFFEVFQYLTPSYSKLTVLPDEDGHGLQVHLRSKLADYGGDAEAQRRDLEATAGMVAALAESLAHDAVTMLQLQRYIDGALGATHAPARPVPSPRGRKQ